MSYTKYRPTSTPSTQTFFNCAKIRVQGCQGNEERRKICIPMIIHKQKDNHPARQTPAPKRKQSSPPSQPNPPLKHKMFKRISQKTPSITKVHHRSSHWGQKPHPQALICETRVYENQGEIGQQKHCGQSRNRHGQKREYRKEQKESGKQMGRL